MTNILLTLVLGCQFQSHYLNECQTKTFPKLKYYYESFMVSRKSLKCFLDELVLRGFEPAFKQYELHHSGHQLPSFSSHFCSGFYRWNRYFFHYFKLPFKNAWNFEDRSRNFLRWYKKTNLTGDILLSNVVMWSRSKVAERWVNGKRCTGDFDLFIFRLIHHFTITYMGLRMKHYGCISGSPNVVFDQNVSPLRIEASSLSPQPLLRLKSPIMPSWLFFRMDCQHVISLLLLFTVLEDQHWQL